MSPRCAQSAQSIEPIARNGEECDGPDLDGATCQSLGCDTSACLFAGCDGERCTNGVDDDLDG